MAERLACLIARFRWQLLAVWLVALGAAGLAAPALPGLLSGGGWDVPGSQSQMAASAMKTGFDSRGASNLTVVVRDHRYKVGSAQFDRRMEMVAREVSLDPRLNVTGTYGSAALSEPDRSQFVGKDQRTAITVLALRIDNGTARRVLPAVQAELADRYTAAGLQVALVSADSFWGEINTLGQLQLTRAEPLAFPLLGAAAVLLPRWVTLGCLVYACAALNLTARRVERRLAGSAFGSQDRQYLARTGRFFPRRATR